ncbi:hypothetical protein LJ707_18585 [Mucilaginibacter sp. UR6-1]|uniref:hypothetical protein n=1 Tax=Mucilaginibacter sp. UR6-1 TaxID=1435643 RepID=UPI001E54F783|nr:hypothetical protein [Mucilaginibacter sp. UR6-1]MCC8410954.1 hypothetical protein [Mucilaginibacter sp. UR6-1]
MNYLIKSLKVSLASVAVILISSSATNRNAEKDYFGINEISFNNISYKLAWSSHPTLQYYKQEYIPEDETVEKFNNMVLIDFIQTHLPLEDAVTAQINILKIRKQTDAVCKYELIKKNNEYILDFLMSEGNEHNLKLLEWNAYHYKEYTDKTGNKGILMFGYSHRAYDADAEQFMNYFSQYRNKFMTTFSSYPMPEIQLK